MSTSTTRTGQWTERCTGQPDPSALDPQAFRRFFERSVDRSGSSIDTSQVLGYWPGGGQVS
ncbi:MAG: hypothetical protein HS113_01290 [Verrucomicrobiales bacterium]|nr:hypothetical protein [Verrucomicrobiales bacterium]